MLRDAGWIWSERVAGFAPRRWLDLVRKTQYVADAIKKGLDAVKAIEFSKPFGGGVGVGVPIVAPLLSSPISQLGIGFVGGTIAGTFAISYGLTEFIRQRIFDLPPGLPFFPDVRKKKPNFCPLPPEG